MFLHFLLYEVALYKEGENNTYHWVLESFQMLLIENTENTENTEVLNTTFH